MTASGQAWHTEKTVIKSVSSTWQKTAASCITLQCPHIWKCRCALGWSVEDSAPYEELQQRLAAKVPPSGRNAMRQGVSSMCPWFARRSRNLPADYSSHRTDKQGLWSAADSASREELQQRLAAKVAAFRQARNAEEAAKRTEAAKQFRASNGKQQAGAKRKGEAGGAGGTPKKGRLSDADFQKSAASEPLDRMKWHRLLGIHTGRAASGIGHGVSFCHCGFRSGKLCSVSGPGAQQQRKQAACLPPCATAPTALLFKRLYLHPRLGAHRQQVDMDQIPCSRQGISVHPAIPQHDPM